MWAGPAYLAYRTRWTATSLWVTSLCTACALPWPASSSCFPSSWSECAPARTPELPSRTGEDVWGSAALWWPHRGAAPEGTMFTARNIFVFAGSGSLSFCCLLASLWERFTSQMGLLIWVWAAHGAQSLWKFILNKYWVFVFGSRKWSNLCSKICPVFSQCGTTLAWWAPSSSSSSSSSCWSTLLIPGTSPGWRGPKTETASAGLEVEVQRLTLLLHQEILKRGTFAQRSKPEKVLI